jgi:ParB/RepB/Spo0J family partition protein
MNKQDDQKRAAGDENGEAEIKAEDLLDTYRIILSPDELIPTEYNPNEMKPDKYAKLKDNIAECGFIDPVIAVPHEDGEHHIIIGGHHRWQAAKELGLKKIPVDVPKNAKWKDLDYQKLQNLRLNIIHGEMNPEKMAKLYTEMADKYGKDKVAGMMGYTSDAPLKKIIKQISKEMKATLPPEMAQQFEAQAKEARTINDLERIIQHLFQEHGDSIRFNFMVFAWGGKEHTYIAMSKKVHDAMKKIMTKCRTANVDINELIGEAIQKAADSFDEKKANGKTGAARA